MSSAEDKLCPGGIWSLWDIMKAFNAGMLTHTFKQLTVYEQAASREDIIDAEPILKVKEDVFLTLAAAEIIAISVQLAETRDAIKRLKLELQSTGEPITHVKLEHGLHRLLDLMQSEMEKRKVFAIDADKAKFYQDDIFGVNPPGSPFANVLLSTVKRPDPLLSERSIYAFPSAYMDVVEAGRCLALNRNNAAIYHLMQVAEIGLRTLAWDRRVTVKRGKHREMVPLDFAQWGEMIGALNKKKELIHQWNRSKATRDNAFRYYSRAIFEVDSFNEIYRKHISHSRGELYQPDVAVSCWGHVYRFMDMLSERMSEEQRTPTVWPAKKKPS